MLRKIRAAQRPGIHAEVLLVDAIMKKLGLNSLEEVIARGIKVIVKGKDGLGHMATCPHCHNILKSGIVINK